MSKYDARGGPDGRVLLSLVIKELLYDGLGNVQSLGFSTQISELDIGGGVFARADDQTSQLKNALPGIDVMLTSLETGTTLETPWQGESKHTV